MASHDKEINGQTEGAPKQYDYGGNPLAREQTNATMLPAFGGTFQPGLYKAPKEQKIANPAPLGLCGFAFTTFLLSLINLGARGTSVPNIVVGSAYAYGGLIQLLAGMWYVSKRPLQPCSNACTPYYGR